MPFRLTRVLFSRQVSLTQIFSAAGQNSRSEDTWVSAIGDERLLLNPGSGNIIALDTQLALEVIMH